MIPSNTFSGNIDFHDELSPRILFDGMSGLFLNLCIAEQHQTFPESYRFPPIDLKNPDHKTRIPLALIMLLFLQELLPLLSHPFKSVPMVITIF